MTTSDLDRATELVQRMPPVAQEVFIRQYRECQGRYDYEDWFERADLTLQFYAAHEWDGLRWRPKE